MSSNSAPASDPPRTLDQGTKIGYAAGSLATGTFGTVPGLLLLFYMTDTLAVPAALAGAAVLVPKFWDVFFNPVVGGWSDRTNHRMGPRRPWMLLGTILLPIFFTLLFAVPAGVPPTLCAFIVGGTFLLSAASYALFQVPYVSLPAEMTDDYSERTTVVAYRIVALTVGILLSGALAPVIVKAAGGGNTGYAVMGVVVALFMGISMLISVVGTRRAPRTAVPSGAANLAVAWRAARGNQYFMPLWIAFIVQALATAAMLATIPYLARYIMNNAGAESTLFIALVAPAILIMPVWRWFGIRAGKTTGYFAASLVFLVGSLGLIAARVIPTAGIYFLVVLAGIGYAGMQLFPLAMLPDTVAVDEAHSGQRRSGMLTGLWTAGETAAFAIGPALVGLVLGAFGFVSSTGGTAVEQTDTAITGILVAAAILPTIAMAISLLLIRRYTLSQDVLDRELAEI
jgi:glycoside/pentoside/hexuronide:cation symporter, GPH family